MDSVLKDPYYLICYYRSLQTIYTGTAVEDIYLTFNPICMHLCLEMSINGFLIDSQAFILYDLCGDGSAP